VPETRPYESLRAKGEDRKQRILAVAQRLLTRNGWRNTTLAQIAGEAGVSPAGLLHHFESKEQLLHAVLDVRDADDDAHADRAGDLISEIAAVADPNTRVFDIEATIPNPDARLRVGMIAALHLPAAVQAKGTVVVSTRAIVRPPDDPKGYAVAQHADYSLVTLDHPVRPGEVLVAYATNLEQFAYVLNYPSVGYPAQANPLPSIAPSSPLRSAPYVTLNSVVAEMFYSGLTPGSVGVFQVNFRVPNATPDGDAILNAVTDTVCINQGLPSGYCIDGKKSLGAKIPVKAAPAP